MTLHTSRPSKGRSSPLPSWSSAVHEKASINGRLQSGLFTIFYLPIPGVQGRQLRLPLPIPPRIYHSTVTRFGRKRGCLIIILCVLSTLWIVFALAKRFGTAEKEWPTVFQPDSTLIFQREDLRKIWEWEIASGHYPSSRKSESWNSVFLCAVTFGRMLNTQSSSSLMSYQSPSKSA